MNPEIIRVPRDPSARIELLALRPDAWEYLLFGAALNSGLMQTEAKWRDHQLGYTMNIGPIIAKSELVDAMNDRMTRVSAIAGNIERVISQRAQDAAFGLPGHPGDPELIEHMAGRVILLYEQLLDWVAEIRSLRVPENAASLPELGAALASQPILATRTFVQEFISALEDELAKAAKDPDYMIRISMAVAFDLDAGDSKGFIKALKRAVR